jgi:hypothetical protein
VLLVGGLLTITGSVATTLISDKRLRTNQHREAPLASGAEALNALQHLNRQLINVAREPEADKPNAGNEFWRDLHMAVARWNSARYVAALYCSHATADSLECGAPSKRRGAWTDSATSHGSRSPADVCLPGRRTQGVDPTLIVLEVLGLLGDYCRWRKIRG